MNEFEQKMSALSTNLSSDAKSLTRHVLDLELRNRFTDRTQLSEEFASKALKIVKARPEAGVGE